MEPLTLEEDRLKQVFKEAIVEVLQERRELFSALLAEVLEDFALLRAIQEGESSEVAEPEEVYRILEGEP